MQVFRSHTQVSDKITSPTLRGLAEEWVRLNESAEHHRQVASLGLDGCFTPGDVVDAIDAGAHEEQNRILLVLIGADSYLMTRIILQALLPRITRMAQHRRHLNVSATYDDHLQSVIEDVWGRAAEYPMHRTKHVAMELLRGSRATAQEIFERGLLLVGDEYVDEVLDSQSVQMQSYAVLTKVLSEGLDFGVVSEEEVELLTEVYVKRRKSRDVAEEFGLTMSAVRKRCQRIRHRLAAVPGVKELASA